MAPRKFDRYMVQIGLGTHPKMARLTDSEFRAHVAGVLAIAAMSPIRGCLLVGTLAAEAVDVAATAGVAVKAARSALVKLEAVGVLERCEEHDCLRVHDWDDINPPPKADSTNASRQARHRDRNAPRNGARNAPSNGVRNASVTPRVTPTEVEVEVELPSSLRSEAPAAVPPGPADLLCEEMSALVRSTHGIASTSTVGRVTKGWVDAARSMLEADGWSEEQVRYAATWVCRHHYWSRRVRSMPRLRSEMEQVTSEIREQKQRGNVVPLNARPSKVEAMWDHFGHSAAVIESTAIEESA